MLFDSLGTLNFALDHLEDVGITVEFRFFILDTRTEIGWISLDNGGTSGIDLGL
jgi:hypothetical protein